MNVILRVVSGPHVGQQYVFDRHSTFRVGRSTEADFSVPDDPFLSRYHLWIEFNPPVCLLKDLSSTNGTRVNGRRVQEFRLRDGDVISAGKSEFQVQVEGTLEQMRLIRCLVCQREAHEDVPVNAEPEEDGHIRWVCEHCQKQRRLYPAPPEGYWIEELIGSGGMGDVYRARALATGRIVAIKVMNTQAAIGDRAIKYFKREMEVLQKLKHPHIVEFYAVDENLGGFQLIMEYVDGPNASQWQAAQDGRPPVRAVVSLGVQLLEALAYAHGEGYVHRDIKPSNLLLKGSGSELFVKLSDFGLAKSFLDNGGFKTLTHQGDVGGSMGFLSPDHLRDFGEVKQAADLYSVGATMYYLLCGKYPYLDFDPMNTNAYIMILEHPTVPVRVHRPEVPEGLDRVLRKSLEKQPRDRWRTAEQMAEALRPYLEVEERGTTAEG